MHEDDLRRAGRYLTDHPPAPAPPVAALVRRARRRRQRRLVLSALVVGAVVAAGGLVADRDPRAQELVTTPDRDEPGVPEPPDGEEPPETGAPDVGEAPEAGPLGVDLEHGVAGALLTVTLSELDDLAGAPAEVWLVHPDGAMATIGAGTVGPDGLLVATVHLPNVIEHESWVFPGNYRMVVSTHGAPPDVELAAAFTIVPAQVQQEYRYAVTYECFDYLWFDARLWVGALPADEAEQLFSGDEPPQGTLRLFSESWGAFTGADGEVAGLRPASPEERRAFDPELFQCPADAGDLVVQEQDRALVDDLVRFARSPGPATGSALGVAPGGAGLGLGHRIVAQRTSAQLLDPAQWSVDDPAFHDGAFVGPFSALERLAEDLPHTTTVGPHRQCVSPPVPPPPSVTHLRQISIQPVVDTCVLWFSVDVYVDADHAIHAVVLDLWPP